MIENNLLSERVVELVVSVRLVFVLVLGEPDALLIYQGRAQALPWLAVQQNLDLLETRLRYQVGMDLTESSRREVLLHFGDKGMRSGITLTLA